MAIKPIVKVTDNEIIRALERNHGSLRLAAQYLKISYSTILKRKKRNPEIEQVIEDAASEMITIAEDVIYNELIEGNWQAAKFTLERLSKEKWGNQVMIQNSEPLSPVGTSPWQEKNT